MAAVDALYRTYIAFCIQRALALGAEVGEAWDVSHELFARLAAGRGWRIDPARMPADGSLHHYIAGAVKYMTLTARRNRGLGTGGDPEYAGQVLEACPVWPVATDNPEDIALRRERIARLTAAIGALSQRQRQIATLRYLHCLSGPDIAARLGIATTVVFTTLYQIREALRSGLSAIYAIPDRVYGYQKFGAHRGAPIDRPRNTRDERYRARRRRQRTLERRPSA
jgi:RNA polymerase sigma factor (sigma-70 family)